MKGKIIVPIAFLCCLFISCRHHGDVSLQYSESEKYYSMNAWFDEKKMRAVEEYMDDKIGRQSNTSFVNTRIDGSIALEDHANFFIKKFPGHLKIELDKRKNSIESYLEIKSLCEGIKDVVK